MLCTWFVRLLQYELYMKDGSSPGTLHGDEMHGRLSAAVLMSIAASKELCWPPLSAPSRCGRCVSYA